MFFCYIKKNQLFFFFLNVVLLPQKLSPSRFHFCSESFWEQTLLALAEGAHALHWPLMRFGCPKLAADGGLARSICSVTAQKCFWEVSKCAQDTVLLVGHARLCNRSSAGVRWWLCSVTPPWSQQWTRGWLKVAEVGAQFCPNTSLPVLLRSVPFHCRASHCLSHSLHGRTTWRV